MADVKLNTLPQSTSPTSTQDLLLFDESTNAGQRINYNTLADVILAKLTSKTYTVGGGTQTLISAIDALNSKLGRLITSGSLRDILTPGIYYIGSSVTDQPVQQNGYGGTYIVSSANENTLVGTYISMYDKSIWSIAKLNADWSYTQMAKHIVLSPTLSGCGSGSSIHAVQIGTVVAVTAKIEYSGSNITITGLPNHNGDTQNGFVVTARDQTDGSVVRMWTNGAKNIMKIDDLTTDHMYGMSYTYIIA